MIQNKLFIIGNGFDLEHGLPTHFNPDFKNIAEKIEPLSYFWDIYQTQNTDIWSDFENLLGKPNFYNLYEIFQDFYPDYLSDKERDRSDIIYQVELNGKLPEILEYFAARADNKLQATKKIKLYQNLFKNSDFFINFNYTHTLENLYNIPSKNILHIHGELGKDDLIMGYSEGEFKPEEISLDNFYERYNLADKIDYKSYIDGVEDVYFRIANESMVEKSKSFEKKVNINSLVNFLQDKIFEEIYVIGHSFAIDFEYFKYLNKNYPKAIWYFFPYDNHTEKNIIDKIKEYKIQNSILKKRGDKNEFCGR